MIKSNIIMVLLLPCHVKYQNTYICIQIFFIKHILVEYKWMFHKKQGDKILFS